MFGEILCHQEERGGGAATAAAGATLRKLSAAQLQEIATERDAEAREAERVADEAQILAEQKTAEAAEARKESAKKLNHQNLRTLKLVAERDASRAEDAATRLRSEARRLRISATEVQLAATRTAEEEAETEQRAREAAQRAAAERVAIAAVAAAPRATAAQLAAAQVQPMPETKASAADIEAANAAAERMRAAHERAQTEAGERTRAAAAAAGERSAIEATARAAAEEKAKAKNYGLGALLWAAGAAFVALGAAILLGRNGSNAASETAPETQPSSSLSAALPSNGSYVVTTGYRNASNLPSVLYAKGVSYAGLSRQRSRHLPSPVTGKPLEGMVIRLYRGNGGPTCGLIYYPDSKQYLTAKNTMRYDNVTSADLPRCNVTRHLDEYGILHLLFTIPNNLSDKQDPAIPKDISCAAIVRTPDTRRSTHTENKNCELKILNGRRDGSYDVYLTYAPDKRCHLIISPATGSSVSPNCMLFEANSHERTVADLIANGTKPSEALDPIRVVTNYLIFPREAVLSGRGQG